MNNLKAQFHKTLCEVYGVDKHDNNPLFKKLNDDKMQFVLLQEMIDDNRHNYELVELVLEKMDQNQFRLGMDAVEFFVSCANQIFFKRLAANPLRKGEDPSARMKRLHPLWGKSYMSR